MHELLCHGIKAVFLQALCTIGICGTTFLFAITWQFNQFVLLLQAMALFGMQVLQMAPHYRVSS